MEASIIQSSCKWAEMCFCGACAEGYLFKN